MATFASVDAYLASLPGPARKTLKRVRTILAKALPTSTDGISYNIPVVKLDGTMVLYFAGHTKHWAIYPSTPALLKELGPELAPRLKSRSIHFAYDEALPTHLIGRIAKVRAAEADAYAASRRKKKTSKARAKKKTATRAKRR